MAHGATVLVGTPGRLADVVARTRGNAAALDLRRLEVCSSRGAPRPMAQCPYVLSHRPRESGGRRCTARSRVHKQSLFTHLL